MKSADHIRHICISFAAIKYSSVVRLTRRPKCEPNYIRCRRPGARPKFPPFSVKKADKLPAKEFRMFVQRCLFRFLFYFDCLIHIRNKFFIILRCFVGIFLILYLFTYKRTWKKDAIFVILIFRIIGIVWFYFDVCISTRSSSKQSYFLRLLWTITAFVFPPRMQWLTDAELTGTDEHNDIIWDFPVGQRGELNEEAFFQKNVKSALAMI